MAWTLVTAQVLNPARELQPSVQITADAVIIQVEDLQNNGWFRAGWLAQSFNVSETGNTIIKHERVRLETPQLIYLDATYLPCDLIFTPRNWLKEIRVRIWRLT